MQIINKVKETLKAKAVEEMLNHKASEDYEYGFYDGGKYVLEEFEKALEDCA